MTWTAEVQPGGWLYRHDSGDATILLDYIQPRGSTYEAWVECNNGSPIPLASGTVNISSPRAGAAFIQTIGDKTNVPWADGLRQAFYETIEAERDSIATQDLADIDAGDMRFIVDPVLEAGGNTRLIAPGESGKSLFADALMLTVTTGNRKFLGLTAQVEGPVLYLDWETNASTHRRRIDALCTSVGVKPPGKDLLHYRNESRPLWRSIQTVERAVRRTGAVMVVVDSRVPAAGPSGQSSGEEATINLHAALREIGPPALILDHKAKEDIRKGRRGGYGSIFNDNLARMVWEVTRYDRRGNEASFVLELTKGNNVGAIPPLGYHLKTDGGRAGIQTASFTRVVPESVVDPNEESLADKILLLYTTSSEPMSVSKIAGMMEDANPDSIRSAMRRSHKFFNVNEGQKGKPGLWRPKEEFLSGPSDDGVQQGFDALVPIEDGVDDEVAVF